MVTWLFGGLVSAVVPLVVVLIISAMYRFDKKVIWVVAPGAILTIPCFVLGVVGALIFGTWWAGVILSTVAVSIWVAFPWVTHKR